MIGVYDSGYGGLTVLRHLRRQLPAYDLCYLGDSGRAPYGGRDVHTLLDFAEQCVERLRDEGCELVIVACHTISCVALRHLQRRYAQGPSPLHVLGVTIPAAEQAVATGARRVGLLATPRTVASGTYLTELRKLDPAVELIPRAARMLAGLVEEGWEEGDVARQVLRRYLTGLEEVEALILGCTHYPLLLPSLQAVLPERIALLDPAPFVAERLADWLRRHPGAVRVGSGRLQLLCTGDPASFSRHGARFLGEALPPVRHIAEVDGHLALRDPQAAPRGQVVRDTPRRGSR